MINIKNLFLKDGKKICLICGVLFGALSHLLTILFISSINIIYQYTQYDTPRLNDEYVVSIDYIEPEFANGLSVIAIIFLIFSVAFFIAAIVFPINKENKNEIVCEDNQA